MAERVDDSHKALLTRKSTVSMIEFATRAREVPGCFDLKLESNDSEVDNLATCLRKVAMAYRDGSSKTRIGDDTNYVAAMEAAVRYLLPGRASRLDSCHGWRARPEESAPRSRIRMCTRARLFGSCAPLPYCRLGWRWTREA